MSGPSNGRSASRNRDAKGCDAKGFLASLRVVCEAGRIRSKNELLLELAEGLWALGFGVIAWRHPLASPADE